MDSFDINRLTDFDFEVVCKDLFESHLGLSLEIFTPGPDDGIDLRYMAPGENQPLIIQCKHWARSSGAALTRHLKNVELQKIQDLNPSRYILATSVSLTPSRKTVLAAALHPYVKSPGDIYGLQEIVSLLNRHPEVVRRHVRLWLSNTTVLQSLLNKRILSRSIDLAEDAQNAALVYVPNPSYRRATEILEDKHVCIISGIPGIGKTTLAQILTLAYANQSYEVYEISEDADEINAVWDDQIPQLFYYDDFLGQTTLDDKLHKNEDGRLLKILQRVNRTSNKRLILTTREYILQQARQRYERIDAENFSPLTCIVSIGDYTNLIRAEILYNHVYFSELTPTCKACFAEPEIYKAIITNSKFNPRLIDNSIRASIGRGLQGEEVAQEVLDNLVAPHRLWEHIIHYQLSTLSVQILIALFSLPSRILLGDLADAVSVYLAATNTPFSDREFRRSLKILENTMIRISPLRDGNIVVEYHNPSIRDYMRDYVFGSPPVLSILLGAIYYFQQIEQLWTYFARWPSAAEMLQQSGIRENIVQVVLRTYQHPTPLFRRCGKALEIAERLDSVEIRESVRAWISSIDFNQTLPNVDDVVSVTKMMLVSKSEEIRKLAYDSLSRVIEYITEETSTWDNARHAQQALHELRSVTPVVLCGDIQDSLDSIEQTVEEEARYLIERVAATGEVPQWLTTDMDQVLEYANGFGDPEEVFPGYAAARKKFMRLHDRAPKVDSVLPLEGNDVEADTFIVIDRMFETLKQSPG